MFKRFRTACLVGMLMLCAIPGAFAGAADAPLPVSDFARMGPLGHPAMSPDGQYLALSLHNEKAKWGQPDYQLVVLHLPDLKYVSRLDMVRNYQPAQIIWVSDTRMVVPLAYTTSALEAPQGTGDIIAVDFDGGHKQTLYSLRNRGQLGSGPHSMDMPRGFPAVVGVPYPRNGHVYLSLAVIPEHNAAGDWDGHRSQIYDVDSMTGKPTLMGDIDHGSMSFVVHDGVARLAYGSRDAHTIDVYMRADARSPWMKIPDEVTGKQMTPLRISRDGSTLWSLYSDHGGPTMLVSSKLDGTGRQVLARDDFASVADVQWDVTSGKPYAVLFQTGRPHLSYLDDSVDAQVSKALNAKFADHLVLLGGSDDSGKRMLVFAQSDRDPGSLALFDTTGMNLQPLFQVEPWIHADRMAERRPFRFKASDGMELEGYLTLPHGSSGKHLPTVLLPHGGPIGIRDNWTYDTDAQFLASRGYAVVQVNYRGSSGRGPGFEMAGYKHFGDRIQQDLLDGLHWAIDQGYADKDRVCVYGGSFGGYSSLMQPIIAPGQYKCAIDYAGVSDWSIGFERSDTSHVSVGRAYFAEAIGDEAAAKAISPLYQLDKFNVPVLIAHGEDDPRVPYQNATRLRDALEKAGKPYEWLSKPKEGHGFYAVDNREDLYRHMQAFLAKYLGQ
ncbi:MAG: prolyl oligopeptidase family serine peptidase [Xanthomonadaceae bacterium]|nr:prolyl oligopeptidase family serine peptidase [Xanthomonadaceae bacterium]MDE1963650.1 S9 family peptidase [Xanthomonadaceae bacterium]